MNKRQRKKEQQKIKNYLMYCACSYTEVRQIKQSYKMYFAKIRRLKKHGKLKRRVGGKVMDEYIKKVDVLQILADNNYTDKITLDLYDKLIREIDKLKVKTRPRRCKGQWIGTEYDGYADGCPVYDTFECSECGWEHYGEEDTLTNYCSNCGAKMK